MKVLITWTSTLTEDVVDQHITTLRQYRSDNPNAPYNYVIRNEIRQLGAYTTNNGYVRTRIERAPRGAVINDHL